MNWKVNLALGAASILVLGLLTGVYAGDVPLGIAGEWEWPWISFEPSIARLLTAGAGVAAYGWFAARGCRSLEASSPTGRREAGWVAGLTVAAVAVQVLIAVGASSPYGLTRWSCIHLLTEATGYYDVARREAGPDPWKFLAEYPSWVEAQPPGHLAVHPPGLIAGYRGLIALMDRFGPAADLLNALTPPDVDQGFREIESRRNAAIPRTDRAALYLASLITLLACAGTVAPLYLLARESLPPKPAWIAAALWPLSPALNLFQPLPDAAFPLLSATALASAAWAVKRVVKRGQAVKRGQEPLLLKAIKVPDPFLRPLAIASGAVMGFGLLFTLALLPVGLIVALVVLTTRSTSWRGRFQVIGWIGVGCVAVVAVAGLGAGVDLPTVWIWNLRKNAGFYEGSLRSYLPWVLANPVELVVAAGLPAALWSLIALTADRRRAPRAFWSALLVTALADLSGGNRGEVARLWMIFLPPLFTAVGVGLDRLGGGGRAVFATIALTGIQTLGLQSLIQVVYPEG